MCVCVCYETRIETPHANANMMLETQREGKGRVVISWPHTTLRMHNACRSLANGTLSKRDLCS